MGQYDIKISFHNNSDCSTGNVNILIEAYYPVAGKPNQQELMNSMIQKRPYILSFKTEDNANSFLKRILPTQAHIFSVQPLYK